MKILPIEPELIRQRTGRLAGEACRARHHQDPSVLFDELESALVGLDFLRSAIAAEVAKEKHGNLPDIFWLVDDYAETAAGALNQALRYIAPAVKVTVKA